MKLILRRDQRSGMLSSTIKFMLAVRAELSDDEQKWVKTYKMGDTVLYQSMELTDKGAGLAGVVGLLAFKMMNLKVTVGDLASGKSIECKDIVEMLAVEEQIKEAARIFRTVLDAAAHFGGEEVVEI